MNLKKLSELEEKIGYVFENKELLQTAIVHKSYANDEKIESNERLEFLGDAILEFVMTKYLYLKLPKEQEGKLTKIRSYVVCEDGLFEVADKLNFEKYIHLGKSQSVPAKPLLADMVESIIAAIYLDGGIEKAEEFALENLKERINHATKAKYLEDFKTILQEKVQAQGIKDIKYETIKEIGPDHEKEFHVSLLVNRKSSRNWSR